MSCAMNSNFEKCGFDQTVSAFVMWFSGLSLGVCFLLGEMVLSRYSRKHTYKLNQYRIEDEIHTSNPIYTDELDTWMTKID